MLAFMCRARSAWAPGAAWRMTMRSGRMDSRFMAVSTRVSPLLRELVSASKLMISADSRFSAISKLLRVRVEFSKNRLTISRLRRAGTILISGRSQTSSKARAWSRMAVMSWGLSGAMPSRWRWGNR